MTITLVARLSQIYSGRSEHCHSRCAEQPPSLILLTGIADLKKFALIDTSTLLDVVGMPLISVRSRPRARKTSCHAFFNSAFADIGLGSRFW
jgi:hypothetical protein